MRGEKRESRGEERRERERERRENGEEKRVWDERGGPRVSGIMARYELPGSATD